MIYSITKIEKVKNNFILTDENKKVEICFNYLTGDFSGLSNKEDDFGFSFDFLSPENYFKSVTINFLLKWPLEKWSHTFYKENAADIEQIVETCLSLGAFGVVRDMCTPIVDRNANRRFYPFSFKKINKNLFLKSVSTCVQRKSRPDIERMRLDDVMSVYFSKLLKVSEQEIRAYWKEEGIYLFFNVILENENQASKIYNNLAKVLFEIKDVCKIVKGLSYRKIINNEKVLENIVNNYSPSRNILLQIYDGYQTLDFENLPKNYYDMPEYENEKFRIIYPKTVLDFCQEGSKQHNCVNSYWKTINPDLLKIGFLRKKEVLNEPFVTFELVRSVFLTEKNGSYKRTVKWSFKQRLARRNTPIDEESAEFLDEYLAYINSME